MNYQISTGLLFAIAGDSVSLLVWLPCLLLCIAAAYLLGSINSAIIISKVFYGEDIRKFGSGNAGTTNMLRTYGTKAAVFTLIFDMLKTVIAIALTGFVLGFQYDPIGAMCIEEWCYVAGLFAVIGHVFPIYYGGKGGKGVLCAATMALMLSPIVFVVLLLAFVILVLMTRYVSLGSVAGVFFYPIALRAYVAVLYPGVPLNGLISLSSIILAVLIIWCHRGNLKRIMNREERQISFKKKEKVPTEQAQEEENK